MLLNVPITAECSVSSLRLAVREIAFGDCYVRHPYEMDLVLYRYLPCALDCALFEMGTQGGVKMSALIANSAADAVVCSRKGSKIRYSSGKTSEYSLSFLYPQHIGHCPHKVRDPPSNRVHQGHRHFRSFSSSFFR